MITAALITYSIMAIIIGLFSFMYALTEEAEPWVAAALFGLLAGAILPFVIVFFIVIALLPIIIPCATAIYIFG